MKPRLQFEHETTIELHESRNIDRPRMFERIVPRAPVFNDDVPIL